MIGPVLYLEMMLGSRRGRQYIFRWIYAGWLILQLGFVFLRYFMGMAFSPWTEHEFPLDHHFLGMLVVQHFILLDLITPAFVAGGITDEKARGTLQYLLTADLSPAEIVIGKYLGRVAQAGVLLLTGLPVLCFAGVFGGLEPAMVFALAVYTGIHLLAIGSISVLASVYCRNTRDAVLTVYSLYLGDFLLSGLLHLVFSATTPVIGPLLRLHDELILNYLNPMYLMEPALGSSDLRTLGLRLLWVTLTWGGIGVACLGVAILQLRPAYIRQLEGEGKKKKERWWRARRKGIGTDPVRWKERQVEGLSPLSVLRSVPTGLGAMVVFAATTATSAYILWSNLDANVTLAKLYRNVLTGDLNALIAALGGMGAAGDAFRSQAIVVMLLASLIVGIRCSGAVSGEREKQTWEALLLTPLETYQIIRGKLWGIIGASYPYLAAYTIPALVLSFLGGPGAFFWTLIWLAVTWLAMYYVGAAGIWCSVRSKSSWRSLLATLGFCYVGGFVLYGPLFFLLIFVALLILLFLTIIDRTFNLSTSSGFAQFIDAYFIAMCIGLAGLFWFLAWFFTRDAEKRVSDLERTRHWQEEFQRRPRKRRAREKYYR